MNMGDLTNRKKVFEHISKAADSIKEIALDTIPGGAVIKAIWHYGSELQTSRSMKFLGDFQKIFEDKLGRTFYEDELQNEDFHDLFYCIMQEVQKTNSEEKLKRFRNILLKQIIEPPKDNGLMFKYVNLINTLTDIQILILNNMNNHSSGVFSDMRESIVSGSILRETKENEIVTIDLENYKGVFIKANLMLYCMELVSYGLVYDAVIDDNKRYKISRAGIAFLDFIENT